MPLNCRERKEQAFTLIELLVVIAILAVLAVAVTLILNPAELIRQGRDSTRLSDLAIINRALGLYQTDQIAQWMGTSTVVYTSLPDTTSTCASYGLPSLPSGWTYHCVQSSSSTRVNGTGWLPVDFTSMSFSSPLARLPLDPVNEATSSKYYTYVSGGSWELSAVMEASSNKLGGDNDRVSGDGGEYPDVYEVGTDLELDPVNRNPNLVGYWKFDEGSGLSAYDASGSGNDGTISVGTSSVQWVSGKKGDYALDFDGVDDYVGSISGYGLNFANNNFSVSLWLKTSYISDNQGVLSHYDNHGEYCYVLHVNSTGNVFFELGADNSWCERIGSTSAIADGNWHYIASTYDNSTMKIYVDGSLEISTSENRTIGSGATSLYIGKRSWRDDLNWFDSATKCNNLASGKTFTGTIDDVRIYNRALSASEIEAMYNSY